MSKRLLCGTLTGALVGALAGCSSAPRTNAPLTASPIASSGGDSFKACASPVIDASESWREVDGDGFTFCVPASWKRDGSRGWRDKGTLSWSRSLNSVRVPFVVGPMSSNTRTAPAPTPTLKSETEMIDGRPVIIQLADIRSGYTINARWTEPQLVFVGQAPTQQAQSLQLRVLRTVQFARP